MRRRALEAQLNDAAAAGHTVLTGPPGSGKTALALQWAAGKDVAHCSLEGCTAWLRMFERFLEMPLAEASVATRGLMQSF